MKTHLAIIFFLLTAFSFCHADTPAAKTSTITVTYTGSDGKSIDVTSANLFALEVTLPLYISDTRHWTAHVAREVENGKPTNQFEMQITDVLTLTPPHGDSSASPTQVFSGYFAFESGKPVTVLTTSFFTITVTVTVPDDKK